MSFINDFKEMVGAPLFTFLSGVFVVIAFVCILNLITILRNAYFIRRAKKRESLNSITGVIAAEAISNLDSSHQLFDPVKQNRDVIEGIIEKDRRDEESNFDSIERLHEETQCDLFDSYSSFDDSKF